MKYRLKITKQTWEMIFKYFDKTYGGVVPKSVPLKDFAKQRVNSSYDQLERLASLKLNKRAVCLDAGCGTGAFLALANLAGFNFYGYDVDQDALEITKLILKSNGIFEKKVSLKAPAFKKKFDLITSFEVVEHLENTRNYLSSLRRLLKPNGKLFIETPNYLIPYEPHFYLFLPPAPKFLQWFIFKLQKRINRKFFYELNFENNFHLEEVFQSCKLKYKNIGKEEWKEAVMNVETSGRSRYIRAMFNLAKEFNLVGLISRLADFGLYTPLVYICYRSKN